MAEQQQQGSFWDQIVDAHNEVVNSVLDALNISSDFFNNGNETEFLSKLLWGDDDSIDKSSSSSSPSALSKLCGSAAAHFTQFRKAINWEEPFFYVMIFVHAMLLSGTVNAIRRGASASADNSDLFFIIWMLVLFALIALSSTLNSLGPQYVDILFPKGQTNYFDDNGLFISVIWAFPLLAQLLVMMMALVATAAKMFAVTKIKKARADRVQQMTTGTEQNTNKKGQQQKKIK